MTSGFGVGGSFGSTSNNSRTAVTVGPMVVVFGRPGAGKTSISEEAVRFLKRRRRLESSIRDNDDEGDDDGENRVGENGGGDGAGSIDALARTDGICDDDGASSANERDFFVSGIDLDVCVPQWMRENFAKGIYPTLRQRKEFVSKACDHVESELLRGASSSAATAGAAAETCAAVASSSSSSEATTASGGCDGGTAEAQASTASVPAPAPAADAAVAGPILAAPSIVSFSFVNDDLRAAFRARFPHAVWMLVNTDLNEAGRRIVAREGHFYTCAGGASANANKNSEEKAAGEENATGGAMDDVVSDGRSSDEGGEEKPPRNVGAGRSQSHGGMKHIGSSGVEDSDEHNVDDENCEWEFRPVVFPHVILDGHADVKTNAQRVADEILELVKRSHRSRVTGHDEKRPPAPST